VKVAINKCYGGFSVSKAVFDFLEIEWDGYGYLQNENFGKVGMEDYDAWRSHPKLIEAIEHIGCEKASGSLAQIEVVTIPDGVKWEIDDYDGIESIHEQHRSW
jgi:hypothetical protein